MKMRKIKPMLMLVAISFILIANIAGNKNFEIKSYSNNNTNILNYPTDAANHDPILIDGNAELATFIGNEGLSGDGTYASPYIIEDFTISDITVNGIEISNTDAYLIIQNCVVEGDSTYCGIFLNNSVNINIKNNTLTIKKYGILLWESNNNTLSGNNASYNGFMGLGGAGSGISLIYSNDNTLFGNILSNNIDHGISLEYSSSNTLSENNVNNNEYGGILMWNSSSNTLSGNIANSNSWGIDLAAGSHNNTLSENIVNNNENGIILQGSINNILSGNNASYNNERGIALTGSSNNTLFGNNVNNNECGIEMYFMCLNNTLSMNNASYNNDYGIYLKYICDNNTIYLNDIYGNKNAEAYEDDDCKGNQWDNGTTGNYWGDDYNIKYPDAKNDGTVWDTPYEIDGDGSGIDSFPLVNSISADITDDTGPKISGFPFVYILIFISVGIFLLRRKIIHRNLKLQFNKK